MRCKFEHLLSQAWHEDGSLIPATVFRQIYDICDEKCQMVYEEILTRKRQLNRLKHQQVSSKKQFIVKRKVKREYGSPRMWSRFERFIFHGWIAFENHIELGQWERIDEPLQEYQFFFLDFQIVATRRDQNSPILP